MGDGLSENGVCDRDWDRKQPGSIVDTCVPGHRGGSVHLPHPGQRGGHQQAVKLQNRVGRACLSELVFYYNSTIGRYVLRTASCDLPMFTSYRPELGMANYPQSSHKTRKKSRRLYIWVVDVCLIGRLLRWRQF